VRLFTGGCDGAAGILVFMGWHEAFGELDLTIARRHELVAVGASGRSLTAAVKRGSVLRVRRDHYALPETEPHILQAVRVGGRLTCTSALASAKVFVLNTEHTHIHLDEVASRLRSPRNRFARLTEANRAGAVLHWWPLTEPGTGNEFSVGSMDALAHLVRCQPPRLAVAALDSALHLGIISTSELIEIFASLPGRFQPLASRVNGKSEAGQESILRQIVEDAGLHVDIQVKFKGLGRKNSRVDMIVEGVLALEADSRLAHDGWEKHVADRWRDLQLAKMHYMSLRPAYQHTMSHPKDVLEAVLGLLAARAGHRTYN
jgi:hypothetical protein